MDKQSCCPKILITIHTTAVHLSHDHVPAESDGILVGPCGVVLGQGGLEEPLGMVVSLCLVQCAQEYQSNLTIYVDEETAENFKGENLKSKDNNEEDAICGEKHSGLFDGPTVAKEGNYED